jgi:hypothetical protein
VVEAPFPQTGHGPHSVLGTPGWGRVGRPTWVRREPVIVERVGALLPVGLGVEGSESIDPEGRGKAGERARAAAARRGAACWRWEER